MVEKENGDDYSMLGLCSDNGEDYEITIVYRGCCTFLQVGICQRKEPIRA